MNKVGRGYATKPNAYVCHSTPRGIHAGSLMLLLISRLVKQIMPRPHARHRARAPYPAGAFPFEPDSTHGMIDYYIVPERGPYTMRTGTEEITTLAGGCFWCLEAVFEQLQGVLQVVSGYSGGHVPDPTYEQVCGEVTGHAEVTQLHFDPSIISFQDLLGVFFTIHDPTTLNRQGPDVGSQYRSAVFYHSPEQKATAEEAIRELERSGTWTQPIVTEVAPVASFYPAGEYHQKYYRRNPGQGYCQFIIAPKVAKFRKQHLARLRTELVGTPETGLE